MTRNEYEAPSRCHPVKQGSTHSWLRSVAVGARGLTRFLLLLPCFTGGVYSIASDSDSRTAPLRRDALVMGEGTFEGRITERTFRPTGSADDLPFIVIIPRSSAPKPWPVLFLLHGHGRNHQTLLVQPDIVKQLLSQDYLIVCPTTRNGWYINSPVKPDMRYRDAMTDLFKLVEREYPVKDKRNGWGIAGWSMGGFGAINHAEYQPERFGFVASIIGLLDFPREEGLPENQRYKIPRDVFGTEAARWADFNPINRIDRLRNTEVFLVIADDAFDLTMNRNFIRAATGTVRVKVAEIHGGHTAHSRDQGVQLVLNEAQKYYRAASPPNLNEP